MAELKYRVFAAHDRVGLALFLNHVNPTTIQPTVSLWCILNEGAGQDIQQEFGTSKSLIPGPIGTIQVIELINSGSDNTVTTEKINGISFNPSTENGNEFKLDCNGKIAPSEEFLMTDLFSPSNVWDAASNLWINTGLKALFIKFDDYFIDKASDVSEYNLKYIGYQAWMIIDGVNTGIIGTMNDDITPDQRCISSLNAISFLRNPLGDITLRLRGESVNIVNVNVLLKLNDIDNTVVASFLNKTISAGVYTDFPFPAAELDIDNNCYSIHIERALADVRLFSPAHTGNCCSTTSYNDECYGAQEVPFSSVVAIPSVRTNLQFNYVVTGSDNDANDDDKCLVKLYVRRNGVETLLYQKETFDLSANRVQESATVTYTPDKNDTSFIVRWEGRHGGAGSSCIGVDQIEILTPSYYYPLPSTELEIHNETIVNNDCNCKK